MTFVCHLLYRHGKKDHVPLRQWTESLLAFTTRSVARSEQKCTSALGPQEAMTQH